MEMSQVSLTPRLPSWKQQALCSIHRRLDLGNLSNSGSILHYGCGAGHAIYQLPHAVGFEPNPKQAQQGIAIGANIFLSEERINTGFDIIFCHEKIVDEQGLGQVVQRVNRYQHRNSTLLIAIGKSNTFFSHSKKEVERIVGEALRPHQYRVVSVEEQYLADYKPILAFYRWFGMSFYFKIITLLGKLKKDKRFIVKAIIDSASYNSPKDI